MHSRSAPSPWVMRWAHLIRPQGQVLDVACGRGRHAHWLALQGFHVTGVDRDDDALAFVHRHWPATDAGGLPPTRLLLADIESQPWPLPGQTFDALVVTHYLWRPLWPTLLASLSPGGVYIHETFAHGNATVGRPSRPEHLLQPGELLKACAGLRIVAYEDGFCPSPERFVQRIVAVRERLCPDGLPARHTLTQPA